MPLQFGVISQTLEAHYVMANNVSFFAQRQINGTMIVP
jgi:hypothetical protein